MERGLSDSRIRLLFSSQQSIRLGQSGKRMHKTGKETEPVMGPVEQPPPGLAFPNMELEQNSSCTDLYRLFRCSSCMPTLWRHSQYNISKRKKTNIRLRTHVTPDFPEQNRKRIYPHKYWTFRIVHFFKVNNKQNEIGQYRWFKGWRFCRFGFCRFCRFCLSC